MIIMDHVNASSLIHNGLSGEKELLVTSDLATGAYPVGSKTAEGAILGANTLVRT